MKINLLISGTIIFCALQFGCKDEESGPTTLTIGQNHEGGIVFYIDNTGQHGLIAALNDQSSSAIWGCEGTDISGATNKNIGSGQNNTTAIVNGCVGPNATNTAARVCSDLSSGGFDDWFLPSSDELDLLYQQKIKVGGFAEETYWSSSQSDANSGWRHNFATNARGGHLKSLQNRVRAIRAF